MDFLSLFRIVFVFLLGFASGLPLALTGTALQAWMTVEGIDIATIGFLSLVGLPYTFKFLWAPLMDRFELPFFPRRKGWLILTQLLLALFLFLISKMSPAQGTQSFALMALIIAFLSASQDVVIDAFRTDVLAPSERGLGSSLSVFGYRLAMIVSGGIAMVWADAQAGSGMNWPDIYVIMSLIMLGAALVTFLFLPKLDPKISIAPKSEAKNDLIGFALVLLTVALGYSITTYGISPLIDKIFMSSFADAAGVIDPNTKKWGDFLTLLLGIIITLPSAYWMAKKSNYQTLNMSLGNYFSIKGAVQFLLFIILYKLGDAFAGSLTTPFLLKGVGFAQAEIGVVNKVIGIWLTIIGAIMGGAIMIRLGLYRSLMLFGILQLLSNLSFYLVAISTKGAWGSFTLPAFDFLIVSLKESTQVDLMLLFAIGVENLTGGMGTAAFVAFLMSLCNQKFTATQFALLSAFASVGRVWVGPLSGVLSVSIGWPMFFIFSTAMAIPGLVILQMMKARVKELEVIPGSSSLDD
jgi:MFS transporter, PAT family, beta-lactamase induction signal transducer AmpG